MEHAYLLCDALTQPDELDNFLCVKLGKADVENLEIECVTSLIGANHSCWLQNLPQAGVGAASNGDFGFVGRSIDRPEADVGGGYAKVGADALRERVIVDLGVEYEFERVELGPFASGVSDEPDHSLVFEEVVVLSRILEPVIGPVNPANCQLVWA